MLFLGMFILVEHVLTSARGSAGALCASMCLAGHVLCAGRMFVQPLCPLWRALHVLVQASCADGWAACRLLPDQTQLPGQVGPLGPGNASRTVGCTPGTAGQPAIFFVAPARHWLGLFFIALAGTGWAWARTQPLGLPVPALAGHTRLSGGLAACGACQSGLVGPPGTCCEGGQGPCRSVHGMACRSMSTGTKASSLCGWLNSARGHFVWSVRMRGSDAAC